MVTISGLCGHTQKSSANCVYALAVTRMRHAAPERLLQTRSTFTKSVMVSMGVSKLGRMVQNRPDFYRAAMNARWSSQKKYVCLFVRPSFCPSVKRVDCDKTEESSVQVFIPYERLFNLVLWEEEWLVGRHLLPEIWDQPASVGAKSTILNWYSLGAPQQ